MAKNWKRAIGIATLIYVILFAIVFFYQLKNHAKEKTYDGSEKSQSFLQDDKARAKKNYASAKKINNPPAGQALGNTQKYEKIASITQKTTDFEADRTRIDELITAQQGQIQYETGTGLNGTRILYLGIGVPADNFDSFVKLAQNIGKTTLRNTVKSDKTNDYLQMRAKRTTLEKTRAALEALQSVGGSIDERINVQSKLSEIEEKIQELGVSLGDFDLQNEFCTVQLTLEEAKNAPTQSMNWIKIIFLTLQSTSLIYASIAIGFICIIIGLWMLAGLFRFVKKTVNS